MLLSHKSSHAFVLEVLTSSATRSPPEKDTEGKWRENHQPTQKSASQITDLGNLANLAKASFKSWGNHQEEQRVFLDLKFSSLGEAASSSPPWIPPTPSYLFPTVVISLSKKGPKYLIQTEVPQASPITVSSVLFTDELNSLYPQTIHSFFTLVISYVPSGIFYVLCAKSLRLCPRPCGL